MFQIQGRRKCREVWPNELLEKTFAVFLDVFLLIIPLLLMTFMYALIVNHLWKKDGERGEILSCSEGQTIPSGNIGNVNPIITVPDIVIIITLLVSFALRAILKLTHQLVGPLLFTVLWRP